MKVTTNGLPPSPLSNNNRTMNTRFRIFLIVLGIWSACDAFSQEGWPEYVSMYSLISTPERYEGKLIKVRGYFFDFARSQMFLYNNREDFNMNLFKNSVWVYSIPEDFSIPNEYKEKMGKTPLSSARAKYVTLVGRFRQNLSYKISSMPTGIIEFIYAEEVTAPASESGKGSEKG
jgi:hypothetical protein